MDASTQEMVTQIAVASIAIVPATLAAIWSRRANKNSQDAVREVKSNGGGLMDESPTLKDYIKQTVTKTDDSSQKLDGVEKKVDEISGGLTKLSEQFEAHLKHSALMDKALAEVYLHYKSKESEAS